MKYVQVCVCVCRLTCNTLLPPVPLAPKNSTHPIHPPPHLPTDLRPVTFPCACSECVPLSGAARCLCVGSDALWNRRYPHSMCCVCLSNTQCVCVLAHAVCFLCTATMNLLISSNLHPSRLVLFLFSSIYAKCLCVYLYVHTYDLRS